MIKYFYLLGFAILSIFIPKIIRSINLGQDFDQVDPLMGTGTTGIAAIKLKRRFIGIEKNSDKLLTAKGRISDFLAHQDIEKLVHEQVQFNDGVGGL
jgi:DNA methylase